MKTGASWEAPALLLAERNRPPQIETIALHAPGPDEVAALLTSSIQKKMFGPSKCAI